MKNEKLFEVLGDINEKHVKEARETTSNKKDKKMKNAYTHKFRGKKTILIAAVVALLLCGTAAAAGLLWMKPNIQANEDSLSLHLNGEIVTLPESAVQKIHAVRDPVRGNKSFFTFDTLDEWQKFFTLPFVASSRLAVDESPRWVDHGTGSIVPEGTIDTIVTAEEVNGTYELCLMITAMNVEWYHGDAENAECSWKGSIMIHTPLNETAAKEGSFTRVMNEDMNAEILMEYTTPAGIPCVISKVTSEHSVTLYLYYGYESVMYELQVMAVSSEEETMILEDLKEIAETLQIIYPTE